MWLNDGTGLFSSGSDQIPGEWWVWHALGDVDGDGDLDGLAWNPDGWNSVWTNNGTGVFTDTGQMLGDAGLRAMADLDGDGDIDVVLGDEIWLNQD